MLRGVGVTYYIGRYYAYNISIFLEVLTIKALGRVEIKSEKCVEYELIFVCFSRVFAQTILEVSTSKYLSKNSMLFSKV